MLVKSLTAAWPLGSPGSEGSCFGLAVNMVGPPLECFSSPRTMVSLPPVNSFELPRRGQGGAVRLTGGTFTQRSAHTIGACSPARCHNWF